MPKPARRPIPRQAKRPAQPLERTRSWLSLINVLCLVVIGASLGFKWMTVRYNAAASKAALPSFLSGLTAEDLARMPDAELARLDPIVVNLIVARGIPGLEQLDIAKHVRTVDGWAAEIKAGLDATEPAERSTELYRHDPDLWRVGGMSVALAGRRFGIAYTADNLDLADPTQTFVHGVLDTRRGTCSSMPVLYLGIAHRLSWPLKAVVSGDHMWTRWDDGRPGGKRFNIEATSAKAGGSQGSFNSLTDEQIAEWLETPRERIASGSDFATLSPRQTLAIYLQARAAYWWKSGQDHKAQADITLANQLFPKNYDIAAFLDLTRATAAKMRGFARDSFSMGNGRYRVPAHFDANAINRGNHRRTIALPATPAPSDSVPSQTWPYTHPGTIP